MSKKIIETRPFGPHAERIAQKRDAYLRLFDTYARRKMSERQGFKTELPLTAHFLIDGSAKLPFKEFALLPSWMKAFFKDGRISRPSDAHVFSDYNNTRRNKELAVIQNTSQHVALRGSRFWDYDGSKAPHGPDDVAAVDLLFDNIAGDLRIIDRLLAFEPKNEFEWVAQIAAWEYIRNDFCALYYSLKCLNSITDESAQHLGHADKALEFVSDHYFDSVLMTHSEGIAGKKEFIELMKSRRDVSKKIIKMVQENTSGRDLLRSHREVNNPMALLNAFRLIYTYGKDRKIHYTEDIKNTDAVLAPLYGGIDLAYAFRYAFGHGQKFVEELFGSTLVDKPKQMKVLPVLSKFGSKGKVRSQLTRADKTISALNTDKSSGEKEKKWVAQEIPNAQNILVIDDSLATGGSNVVFAEWVNSALGRKVNTQLKVIYSNLRWAKYQSPLEKLMDADPLAQSPIIRNMEKASYEFGSRFIPDAVSSGLLLRTDFSFLDLQEAMPAIIEKFDQKIIKAVGFDLDDTLIQRSVDAKQRRNLINQAIVALLGAHRVNISVEKYAEISYKIIQSERGKSHQDPLHPIDILSYNKLILQALGITQRRSIETIAKEMTEAELAVDAKIVKAAPGAEQLLRRLRLKKIPYGIFSNSHYTQSQIIEILSAAKLSEYFNRAPIVTSAEKGTPQKPNPGAVKTLAERMNVDPKELAYIGNSYDSDVIGASKGGAIAFYVPATIDRSGRNTRKKITRWRTNLRNA